MHVSKKDMVFLLTLTLLHISTIAGSTVAPGDEAPRCEQLRALKVTPINNMRVLMDSWNYENLLPPHIGAVWDQVDNDGNNPSGIATNVSRITLRLVYNSSSIILVL